MDHAGWAAADQGICGDVLGDDGAGGEPAVVADGDGGDVEDNAVEVHETAFAEGGVDAVLEVQGRPDLGCC